jgi:hypothetical protein
MKIFQKLNNNFVIYFLTIIFSIGSENFIECTQRSPKTKVDGLGNLAVVWVENDDGGNNVLMGAYGPGFPTSGTALTSNTALNVGTPRLVTSTSASTSTTGATAVAVYEAVDVTTFNTVIVTSIATSSGWNTTPITLSLDDGTESPNNDYRVSISADGETIIITWSSFLTTVDENVLRASVSTDGGTTFTSQASIP